MQANTNSLHPLLTVAAISVTVLSAVGVSAMTGLLPVSKSQERALELPQEVAKPIAPAITHPVSKPVTRKAAPRPAEPAVYREYTEAPRLTQSPQPQVAGQLAVVESVREVREAGDAKGVGAIAGGVVGGVLGNKIGKGKGLATILGAAGGAFAGHQIERQARADKRWEIALRLDDGSQRTLTSDVAPAWRAGERVRLVDGKLQAI